MATNQVSKCVRKVDLRARQIACHNRNFFG